MKTCTNCGKNLTKKSVGRFCNSDCLMIYRNKNVLPEQSTTKPRYQTTLTLDGEDKKIEEKVVKELRVTKIEIYRMGLATFLEQT